MTSSAQSKYEMTWDDARARDPETWRMIARFVLQIAIKLVMSVEAEDLAQDALHHLIERLDRYRPGMPFRAWIARVATHRMCDMLRKKNRLKEAPLSDAEGEDEDFVDPACGDESVVAEQIDGHRLIAALRAMDELHRAVVLLWVEGLSYGEIADVLQIQENTVKSRLHRARRALLATCALERTTKS